MLSFVLEKRSIGEVFRLWSVFAASGVGAFSLVLLSLGGRNKVINEHVDWIW